MDIERLTHSGYKRSVAIAIVLSAMVVTFAAVLGRGAINLRGALIDVSDGKPSDIAVILVVEEKLHDGIVVSQVHFLREEKRGEDESPYYAYQVQTSDGEYLLVKLGFNLDEKKWQLVTFESLRADPVMSRGSTSE